MPPRFECTNSTSRTGNGDLPADSTVIINSMPGGSVPATTFCVHFWTSLINFAKRAFSYFLVAA